MRVAVIVKFEPAGDRVAGLTGAGVVAQVNLLDLQAAPQTLNEDVVQRPAPPVVADLDPGRQQSLGEGHAGELAVLVAVEDLGAAKVRQDLVQRRQAEVLLQRQRDAPGEHAAAVLVDHRRQVDPAPAQADIGDVGGSDLVHPPHLTPRSR